MAYLLLAALVLALAALFFLAHFCTGPARPRLVCFGNSLTTCGGLGGRYSDYLAGALPGYEVLNRGVSGATLADGRRRFQREVLDLHPKVLVFELVANDFLRAERPVEEMRADMEFMLKTAREQGIEVVVAGVFGEQLGADGRLIPKEYTRGSPELGRQLFEMERELARQYGCRHVENIQADLNRPEHWYAKHPSASGNRLVAQRLLPALQEPPK
jgi:hypothetical protein